MTDVQDTIVMPDNPPYSESAVFTWFGVAAAAAQTFETSLATFTIIMHLSEIPGRIPSNLTENPFKSLEKKTMGRVLSQAREIISFHKSLDESLQEAVNTRNYLFHHFFPSNSSKMESEVGRGVIVEDLQKAIRLFNNMGEALLALCEPTLKILNMPHSEIDAELKRWRHEQIDL
jgi:hypothetical protein